MNKFLIIIAVLAVALIGVGAYAVTQNSSSNARVATLKGQVATLKSDAAAAKNEAKLEGVAATEDRRQAFEDGLLYADGSWIAAIKDYGDQLKAAGLGALAANAYAWAKDAAYNQATLDSLADDYMSGAITMY